MSITTLGAALSLVLLVACAGVAAPSPAPSIHDRQFVSTSVTEGGVERALVAGTHIRLAFEDGRVGASAGCNHIGGEYGIDAGRLIVGNLVTTAMGCDPERHVQDEWLSAFLGAGSTLSVDDVQLTLQSGNTRIVLADARIADPDQPLIGSWRVEVVVRGGVGSSIADGVRASLEFASDGSVLVFSGCNRGAGPVLIGEGVLTFGDIASTRMACAGPESAVEAAVLAVLGSRRVAYEVDGETLRLRAGEFGLDLRAGSDFAIDN